MATQTISQVGKPLSGPIRQFITNLYFHCGSFSIEQVQEEVQFLYGEHVAIADIRAALQFEKTASSHTRPKSSDLFDFSNN